MTAGTNRSPSAASPASSLNGGHATLCPPYKCGGSPVEKIANSFRARRDGFRCALPILRFRRAAHTYLPLQCLYFLPEPQGQSSLRPTLPQVAGFLGSRSAVAWGTKEALANAISSSPVLGSNLCASIAGSTGACSSGGMISNRINCGVTASRRCAAIDSYKLNASDLYSCSGSRWP